MIVLDTSGLLCLLDAGEKEHKRAAAVLEGDPGPFVTIDFVLAETDYLILRRLGAAAERAFLAQVIAGAILREEVGTADLRRARSIAEHYQDHDLGLTDAALMAVCERLDSRRVLTLDHHHFAIFRDRRGRPLQLLPA
jgi:predicted nucleic acid-binding protein